MRIKRIGSRAHKAPHSQEGRKLIKRLSSKSIQLAQRKVLIIAIFLRIDMDNM